MPWHEFHSPLTIAVLAGGSSSERDISLESGANVLAALDAAGHVAVAIDPAECSLAEIAWSRFDACFIALHGGEGEDGRIQQRLDLLKVCYTGSGHDASRLAMSKSASKERFLAGGIPTTPYVLLGVDEPIAPLAGRIEALGLPLVVKPDSQGSSLGVGVAEKLADVPRLLADCRRYDHYAIAEPFIAGREFTVAILGREAPPALRDRAACAAIRFRRQVSRGDDRISLRERSARHDPDDRASRARRGDGARHSRTCPRRPDARSPGPALGAGSQHRAGSDRSQSGPHGGGASRARHADVMRSPGPGILVRRVGTMKAPKTPPKPSPSSFGILLDHLGSLPGLLLHPPVRG